MARVARAIVCELRGPRPFDVQKNDPAVPAQVSIIQPPKMKGGEAESAGKILLQPRLCTLRSYGEDRFGVVKSVSRKESEDEVSRFFGTLSDYIESSKKSHDFEIISGRLAMIMFAATVTSELVTGNSVFTKMDLQALAEALGVCLGAVTCAAIFAWFSSARNRVGSIFVLGCNTFIDSLIDDIVDGLFYESELSDWSDDM